MNIVFFNKQGIFSTKIERQTELQPIYDTLDEVFNEYFNKKNDKRIKCDEYRGGDYRTISFPYGKSVLTIKYEKGQNNRSSPRVEILMKEARRRFDLGTCEISQDSIYVNCDAIYFKSKIDQKTFQTFIRLMIEDPKMFKYIINKDNNIG